MIDDSVSGAPAPCRVEAGLLLDFYHRVLEAVGAPPENADVVGHALLDADLRGIDTHGLARLPVYVDRVQSGGVDAAATPSVVSEDGAVTVFDAHRGFGQVAAIAGTRRAMSAAREHGVGIAMVRGSNHIGALDYYTRIISERKMIGFAASGVAPLIAPWGGATSLLGSNPWSVAVPIGDTAPIVADMSNAAAVGSEVRRLRDEGRRLPAGWALDRLGEPTTDPVAALDGSFLPAAGAKGYAQTLVLELLVSVLSGSSFSDDIASFDDPGTPKNLGHLHMAWRINAFDDESRFAERGNDLRHRVKEASPKVRIPGERRAETENERRSDGVPVDESLLHRVNQVADLLGVARL